MKYFGIFLYSALTWTTYRKQNSLLSAYKVHKLLYKKSLINISPWLKFYRLSWTLTVCQITASRFLLHSVLEGSRPLGRACLRYKNVLKREMILSFDLTKRLNLVSANYSDKLQATRLKRS